MWCFLFRCLKFPTVLFLPLFSSAFWQCLEILKNSLALNYRYWKITNIIQHITSPCRVTANLWFLNYISIIFTAVIWVVSDRLYFSLFVILRCLFAGCNYKVCYHLPRWAVGWIWVQCSGSWWLVLSCLSSHKLQAIPVNFARYPINHLLCLDENHLKPLSNLLHTSPLSLDSTSASTRGEP